MVPSWAVNSVWQQTINASYKLHLTVDKQCPPLINTDQYVAQQNPRKIRNSVSVISMNKTPKVFAPLPRATNKGHLVCPQTQLLSANESKATNVIVDHYKPNVIPIKGIDLYKPKSIIEQKSKRFGGALHHSFNNIYKTNSHTISEQNNKIKSESDCAEYDDDDDDALVRDGAQALLKFASGAFHLNGLVKQDD